MRIFNQGTARRASVTEDASNSSIPRPLRLDRKGRPVHGRKMNVSGDATKDYFCPMTVIEAPKPVLRGPAVWPLGVKAYHALGDLGLIPEKTELLYGQIFHKMSQSPLHSFLSEFLEDI
ncbi:MAG: hypothetical protein AAB676_01635, partial [Verrucomicrobiota bacterium]